MTYRKDFLFKNVNDRYRTAQFQKILEGGEYWYKLTEPFEGSDRVIVPAIYTKGTKDSVLRQRTLLFLERKTGAGNWIAIPWRKDENPWATQAFPIVGTPLHGTIVRFVNAEIAIANVEVSGKLMEVSVFREDLPRIAQSNDIRSTLHIGDMIAGNLRPPDYDNLRLSIDVRGWLERQHLNWDRDQSFEKDLIVEAQTNVDRAKIEARKKEWQKHLNGKMILHIEDDNLLCELYQKQFLEAGADVTIISEVTSAKSFREDVYAALRENPDFILLDFQINIPEEDTAEIRKSVASYLIRNPSAACAVISGNINAAKKFARDHSIGCLLKPIPPADVMDWMCDPKPYKNGLNNAATLEHSPFWAKKSRTQEIIKKANILLDALCNRMNLEGAMWFIEVHPGTFELRAQSKKFEDGVSKDVISNLSRSVVGHAASTAKVVNRKLPDNDPLLEIEAVKSVGRVSNPFVYCLPLEVKGQGARVVTFVNDQGFSEKEIETIKAREDHFRLLIDDISQAEEVDEISAAATIGRQALGAMHEIRHSTTKIVSLLEPSSGTTAENKLALVRVLVNEMVGLSHGLMANYRPVRDEQFKIGELVNKIQNVFEPYMRDENADYLVQLSVDVAAISDLRLAMSPIPLERTLSNLLENANTFVGKSPLVLPRKHVRKIWIKGFRDNENPDLPLKIAVSDSGPGLDVTQYANLFRPRYTSLHSEGTGLGLYLSRRLIESVGGALDCEKTPRWGGARFVISLPEVIGSNA